VDVESGEPQTVPGVRPLLASQNNSGSPAIRPARDEGKSLPRPNSTSLRQLPNDAVTPLTPTTNQTPQRTAPLTPPRSLGSYTRQNPRTEQCQGKNKYGERCNAHLEWHKKGPLGEAAQRLVWGRFCSHHAKKQDDEYPLIDLAVSPDLRPPRSPYYPDEAGLRSDLKSRERKARTRTSFNHPNTPRIEGKTEVGREARGSDSTVAPTPTRTIIPPRTASQPPTFMDNACRTAIPMPSTFTPRTQEDEEDDEDAYEDEEHYECEDSRCSDEIRHDMCMSLAACDDPENAHEYLFCRGGNVSDHLHETTPRRDRRGERDRKQTLTMSGSSAPAELPSVAVGT